MIVDIIHGVKTTKTHSQDLLNITISQLISGTLDGVTVYYHSSHNYSEFGSLHYLNSWTIAMRLYYGHLRNSYGPLNGGPKMTSDKIWFSKRFCNLSNDNHANGDSFWNTNGPLPHLVETQIPDCRISNSNSCYKLSSFIENFLFHKVICNFKLFSEDYKQIANTCIRASYTFTTPYILYIWMKVWTCSIRLGRSGTHKPWVCRGGLLT